MVDNLNLDRIFQALSDSTRRAIMAQLAKGECTVSELAEPHNQTFAGISKHLKVLESADLVQKTKNGREMTCRANIKPLSDVYAVLEQLGMFWRQNLDNLELYFEKELKKAEPSKLKHSARKTKK